MAYLIAEIGFSHSGDLDLALRMIESAARSGADAVKFQSFFADDLYFPNHELYPIFKAGEISPDAHRMLKNAADSNGVDFLSTPFSVYWVDELSKLNPAGYKIASMDLNNPVLLAAVARKGGKVYLSTGGGELEEARQAVALLRKNGAAEICVFHCVSNYPTMPEEAMLGMIPELKKEMGVRVGFSDHTLGTAVATAAVALGAEVIEKHFTIDKNLPGPDHKISANPEELSMLKKSIKEAENAIKAPLPGAQNRPDSNKVHLMRRGIYAACAINKGDVVTLEKLKLVRPEVTPLNMLDSIVGKPARKDFKEMEPL
ncbi:MAG: N-acetylneuraminate synthase family protein [Nitrospinae bacterium]|nr:N-acetylneuraminate synthase family protein [Nitrospinota bacterium]